MDAKPHVLEAFTTLLDLLNFVDVSVSGDLLHRPLCEQQGCRVFWDRERLGSMWTGTGTVAEVRRYMGRRWSGTGAF